MIVALNNKSNLTKEQFDLYIQNLEKVQTDHQLILCPNYLHLSRVIPSKIYLGAQNVSKNNSGAHTGEISAEQLKSFGVSYCIVGHSERRQELNETNEDIKEKILRLFEHNIVPILCVGETQEEREEEVTKEVIEEELRVALSELDEQTRNKVIIAYEPIWSIGTGLIPTNAQIEEVNNFIKERYDNKVLYGGSANEKNIEELSLCSSIDGYLLGGLSLKPENLQEFVNRL